MATVRKDLGVVVARMVGESSAMDAAARKVQNRARAAAASHRQTGAYISGIKVRSKTEYNGVRDREIISTDPASQKIEFGHSARRSKRREGPARWVPGQFIMTNAARGKG